jgi:hypothetical protein
MTTAVLVAKPTAGLGPAFRIGPPLTERVLDALPGPIRAVAAILTSVTAVVMARLLLSRLGM